MLRTLTPDIYKKKEFEKNKMELNIINHKFFRWGFGIREVTLEMYKMYIKKTLFKNKTEKWIVRVVFFNK